MTLKIAINGFGRIGRNIVRAVLESGRKDIEITAINDLGPVDYNAHLLEFDTVHGRLAQEIAVQGDMILAGTQRMKVTAEPDPAKLPWDGVDIALECTGKFTARDKAAAHLENGSKRVLVSAPSEGADRTIVFGVNDTLLTAADKIVSCASCTTNCLAPVAKVLNDSIGITRGFMTTVHSYTGDQPTLDRMHKDLYRARAAAANIIPTTTGAARAVGLVLPELDGRLDGTAIRVPTPNVSAVDFTFNTPRDTTADEINAAISAAASTGPLKGILAYSERPLVSSDYNHHPASSIFAADQTRVLQGDMCRILCWYDNEWGFSNRMADVAAVMGKLT
jgi:glyceraldehyde 3-phosphate dehydrogenase